MKFKSVSIKNLEDWHNLKLQILNYSQVVRNQNG